MTDRDLTHLVPKAHALCLQFLSECKAQGYNVIVIETWRDPAREDALYAQGITRATGANCKHCFVVDGEPASEAFDFAVLNSAGQMVQDGLDKRYTACGQIAKSVGLKWGGDFQHRPDYDHCEI